MDSVYVTVQCGFKGLINDRRLKVPRDKVLTLMRQTDPECIALRKVHRYRVKESDYVLQLGVYDKLKLY